MLRGLPEPTLPIFACVLMEYLSKRFRHVFLTMVKQLATCELSHVVEGVFQSFGIELHIEQDGMQMSGHDDLSIDPKIFVPDTVIEAVGDDLAGGLIDEDGQPFDDREGDVIQPHICHDPISFHDLDYMSPGDLRSMPGGVGIHAPRSTRRVKGYTLAERVP